MSTNAINNYSKLKPSLFLLPFFLLIAIVVFLYSNNALSVDGYPQIQKNCFLFLNSKLSQFALTQFNLTQLGDALISLSLLTIFIVSVPKMWEALISASLVSAIFSNILKSIFAVPRPARVFDNTTFTIIGEKLTGNTSLPSGHSITIFTTLTVLLFAFMPQKLNRKIVWSFFIITLGLMLVFTRVGVGAHYPLDAITGGLIGYVCGLIGIFISRKYRIWSWIGVKKYYPVFMILLPLCFIAVINKIMHHNLPVFYLALISLVVSLYQIINTYVKK